MIVASQPPRRFVHSALHVDQPENKKNRHHSPLGTIIQCNLPEFLEIQVADGTPLREPMYFYLSFARRQDQAAKGREPLDHKVLKYP